MLQHTILLSAITLWVASIFDSSLGNMLYFVWGMAFIFSIYSYSLFFASISLLMSVSYLLMIYADQGCMDMRFLTYQKHPLLQGIKINLFSMI